MILPDAGSTEHNEVWQTEDVPEYQGNEPWLTFGVNKFMNCEHIGKVANYFHTFKVKSGGDFIY